MLKKYDIVKKKCGFWGDEMKDPYFEPDELHIIKECYGGEYYIVSLEDGAGSAWWSESQLEFVRKGTLKDLIDLIKANKIHKKDKKQQKNLMYIKENYNNFISADAVVYLFKKIGYDSSFNHNGEYYILEQEWLKFKPLFDAIFCNDEIETDKQVEVFKNYCCKKKVKHLFENVNGRK